MDANITRNHIRRELSLHTSLLAADAPASDDVILDRSLIIPTFPPGGQVEREEGVSKRHLRHGNFGEEFALLNSLVFTFKFKTSPRTLQLPEREHRQTT